MEGYMKAQRRKGTVGIALKEILVRLPTELVEILDERVLELRGKGYPASRTFLLQQAVEQYATLGRTADEGGREQLLLFGAS